MKSCTDHSVALAILITCISWAWSCPSFAMEVQDPAQQGKVLEEMFPRKAGMTGFQCNRPIKFSQNVAHCDYFCDPQGCKEDCQYVRNATFLVQAENCKKRSLDVVSTLSWATQVKFPTTEKFGQTWIQEFLSSFDFFIVPSGTMRIDAIGPGPMATLVDENGEEHRIPTVRVFLSYQQAEGVQTVSFVMDLYDGKTGIEQILYFGDHLGENYFFKRWGYLRW